MDFPLENGLRAMVNARSDLDPQDDAGVQLEPDPAYESI
jgi:hypothetical protein